LLELTVAPHTLNASVFKEYKLETLLLILTQNEAGTLWNFFSTPPHAFIMCLGTEATLSYRFIIFSSLII